MIKDKRIFQLIISSVITYIILVSCSRPEPKSQEEIQQESKNVTVLIDGTTKGSGVIIKKENDTYYVLTAKHVVGIKPSNNIEIIDPLPDEKNLPTREDPYLIITPDEQKHEINSEETILIPNIDLAIVKFISDKDYPVATLSTNISANKPVYMYGFKNCDKVSLLKDKDEFNSGEITKIDDNSAKQDEGYGVNYTNPTVTGMSGSPVFNEFGQVIAIHGKPGKPKAEDGILNKCSPLNKSLGNNWGISIKTFSQSDTAKQVNLKFN